MLSRNVSPVIAPTSPTVDQDTAARVALAVAGVAGDPGVAVAIHTFGTAARFVAAVHDETDHAAALTPLVRSRIRTLATGAAVARVLEETRRQQLRLVTPSHAEWPTPLDALRGVAPLLLWTRGDAAVLNCPSIALTGTAAPTEYGIHMAIELATGLAGRGWSLIAGAGSGVDQLVLRSAVAMKGKTVTVAATSLDHLRDPEEGGVQVSELPPGGRVTIRSQRRAKHLVAALGAKTIIVEAGISSSAMRTAEAAHAMSRPVGVVPGPVNSPFSAGCHILAQRHRVELITSIRDADWLH